MTPTDVAKGGAAAPVSVRILYFARLREAVGAEAETLVLPPDVHTAGALREHLRNRGGVWAEALAPGKAIRMAVDQEMAAADRTLADGAEVAFFPPVTGG